MSGIGSIVIGVALDWNRYKPADKYIHLAHDLFYAIGCACFAVAFYRVWLREHNGRLEALGNGLLSERFIRIKSQFEELPLWMQLLAKEACICGSMTEETARVFLGKAGIRASATYPMKSLWERVPWFNRDGDGRFTVIPAIEPGLRRVSTGGE